MGMIGMMRRLHVRLLSPPGSLCHGFERLRRNRQSEGTFLRLASCSFNVAAVSAGELHDVYQTGDVTVLRLVRQGKSNAVAAEP